MATFERTKRIGEFPEHQQGFTTSGWEVTDETSEAWSADKEIWQPSLKEGEDPTSYVIFPKDQWKRIE